MIGTAEKEKKNIRGGQLSASEKSVMLVLVNHAHLLPSASLTLVEATTEHPFRPASALEEAVEAEIGEVSEATRVRTHDLPSSSSEPYTRQMATSATLPPHNVC